MLLNYYGARFQNKCKRSYISLESKRSVFTVFCKIGRCFMEKTNLVFSASVLQKDCFTFFPKLTSCCSLVTSVSCAASSPVRCLCPGLGPQITRGMSVFTRQALSTHREQDVFKAMGRGGRWQIFPGEVVQTKSWSDIFSTSIWKLFIYAD